jgi:hypothetical protein
VGDDVVRERLPARGRLGVGPGLLRALPENRDEREGDRDGDQDVAQLGGHRPLIGGAPGILSASG